MKTKIDTRKVITTDLIIGIGQCIKFPNLKSIIGNVYVRPNAKFDAPILQTCGYVDVSENAKFDAPVLQTCGNVYVSENAKFDSKMLKFEIKDGNFTYLKFKNKKLYAYKIDGSIFIQESEKTTKGINVRIGYNFLGIDNGTIIKENCFIASKDNYNAHGKTVKAAISDLQFKIVAEKLKKDPIKKDTIITVQYYRIVTGACEMGCKSWMQQNNIKKESYKASELLPLLEKTNAYGLERFKSLITF